MSEDEPKIGPSSDTRSGCSLIVALVLWLIVYAAIAKDTANGKDQGA